MAICYDKHMEAKNRWQTQKIAKHFKNQSNSLNYSYYSSDSYRSYKLQPFDLKDHQSSIQSNNIPIWTCSRCTYKNTQRKSRCTLCNLSYKSSKKTPSSPPPPTAPQRAKTSPHDPHHVILADFCKNIADQVPHVIPVWICNECTYCNVEQLPQCQLCLNPYTDYVKYTNLLTDTQQQHDEYFSAAEQQLILESVAQSNSAATCTKIESKEPQRKTPIVEARRKFSVNQLTRFQHTNSCQSMPQNIINAVPEILAPGLASTARKRTPTKPRQQFTINAMISFREHEECQSMPANVINPIPEILAAGLGQKMAAEPRRKFDIEKLRNFRQAPECQEMPDNVIAAVPEILASGLAQQRRKAPQAKRVKFNMDSLMKWKDEASCKAMPADIINAAPEILAPGLGKTAMRKRFNIEQLMSCRKQPECTRMPMNAEHGMRDILAVGLGSAMKANANRKRFDISALMGLRFEAGYDSMPSNVLEETPEILAPGLGFKMELDGNTEDEDEEKLVVLDDVYDDHHYDASNDDSDDDHMDGILITHSNRPPNRNQKHANNGNGNAAHPQTRRHQRYEATLSMKMSFNRNYLPSVQYDKNVEGVTCHNLLECTLDIFEANANYVSSTSFVPSHDTVTDLAAMVAIPVAYRYKHDLIKGSAVHPSDCRVQLNYEPLKGIAEQIVNLRYPELAETAARMRLHRFFDWRVDIPPHKHIICPVKTYELFGVLRRYLYLADLVKYVLFDYLGYHEVDVVKLHKFISSPVILKKCKLDANRQQLVCDNGGRLPFRVQATSRNSVRSVIGGDCGVTEIGFVAETSHRSNFGRNRRSKFEKWREEEFYNKYTKTYYYRDKQHVQHHEVASKKEKRIAKRIEMSHDIRRLYPKKFLFFRKRQQRDREKRVNRSSVFKKRACDLHSRCRHRYVQRKWSAYWKLQTV
eukprot:CAMPEP_0197028404 /NCGR_PEP_ID=MMETSP1384-20130603/8100_1 /TAXON_ID=29189 /ORGANISM="Ammonia sp." /LENGTH=925 /DNA_ID=CAMNT_0042457407 /DNA_START=114 /DNA_END=2891 /DNA_ORIENTATION=+